MPTSPSDADIAVPCAEQAIGRAALQALRLLPDEPEHAMRVHADALSAAQALGDERGLLRLQIVALNHQARFGSHVGLAEAVEQAKAEAERRRWMEEVLLASLLALFIQTLGDQHAAGAAEAERLYPLVEQYLDPIEISWLDIMAGHFRGYLDGWAEQQKRAYLSLKRLVDSPEAPAGLLANTKKNIGYSHLLVQNADLAQIFLRDAFELYAPLPMTPRKLSAIKTWAQCLLEFGEVQQADALLSPVLDARDDLPTSLYLASALLVGAEVKLLLGDADAATRYCRDAERTLNAAQEPSINTHLAYVHTLLLLDAGRAEAALKIGQRGCDQMTPNTHEVVVQKCLVLTAQLHANVGNFERAYALQCILLDIRSEMARKAAEIRHVELHIDHQAHISRLELEHVNKARAIAEAAEVAIARKNAELEQRLAEVERLQETLRDQANRDVLTGLFNRRYLRSMFSALLSQARRSDEPITLVLLDLDHFKQVNDQYGHQMGDQVLITLANLMQAQFRGHDLCCRYGGEEFCVVMVGIDEQIARGRMEALQAELAAHEIHDEGQTLRGVGFSAGLISFAPSAMPELDLAFRRADEALYAAKHAGRRQVVSWHAMGGQMNLAPDQPGR